MTTQPGATTTWTPYPGHGTMQDPQLWAAWHEAFSRALVLAGGQARAAGIQVHVAHPYDHPLRPGHNTPAPATPGPHHTDTTLSHPA
ncbi:hypothetical protein [Streptomyces griseorubens]|uniref:hypothetical protein n=1 Tax=Streptomyces griseorubens TaxID=66897 RepID=UPI003516930E